MSPVVRCCLYSASAAAVLAVMVVGMGGDPVRAESPARPPAGKPAPSASTPSAPAGASASRPPAKGGSGGSGFNPGTSGGSGSNAGGGGYNPGATGGGYNPGGSGGSGPNPGGGGYNPGAGGGGGYNPGGGGGGYNPGGGGGSGYNPGGGSRPDYGQGGGYNPGSDWNGQTGSGWNPGNYYSSSVIKGWVRLGSATAGKSPDRDTIQAFGRYSYSRIKLCVRFADVAFYNAKVQFEHGGSQDINVQSRVRRGQCTREYYLRGGRKLDIRYVYLFFRQADNIANWRTAQVDLYAR